jgi:hypothetical protein
VPDYPAPLKLLVLIGAVGASWLSIAKGIWALFDQADKFASDSFKKRIGDWLRNVRFRDKAPPSSHFYELFIAVFGERHWSLRCLRGSITASCVLFLSLLLLWMALSPARPAQAGNWVNVAILTLTINGVTDYLSLWKARAILRRMEAASVRRLAGFAAIDAAFSLMMGCVGLVLGGSAVSAMELGLGNAVSNFGQLVTIQTNDLFQHPSTYFLFTRDSWIPPQAVWIYTTLFTSLWVFLVVGSVVLLKIVSTADFLMRALPSFIDFEQPMRALSAIATMVFTLAYVTAIVVSFAVGWTPPPSSKPATQIVPTTVSSPHSVHGS